MIATRKNRIRENETSTTNLIKALETGKAVDIISAQIEKRQNEKTELEAQLAKEKLQAPLLKYEQVRFFFERFAKGGVDDFLTDRLENRRNFRGLLKQRNWKFFVHIC